MIRTIYAAQWETDDLSGVRMTKLPPGFIHEVPQHLSHPDVPKDDRTGVPFVDLENYCCGEFAVARIVSVHELTAYICVLYRSAWVFRADCMLFTRSCVTMHIHLRGY